MFRHWKADVETTRRVPLHGHVIWDALGHTAMMVQRTAKDDYNLMAVKLEVGDCEDEFIGN
jgi:hypothetical protein